MNKIKAIKRRAPKNIVLPHIPRILFDDNKKKYPVRIPPFYPSISTPRFYNRECVSRVSYNSGSPNAIERSTQSAIDYLLKNDDVNLLASSANLSDINNAQDFFKGKRILRICLSPEDNDAPLEEVVRGVISTIETHMGQKITYLSAVHTDTEHRHAHIVISREDGGRCSATNPLIVPKRILINECRKKAQYVITSALGFMSEEEYINRFKERVFSVDSAKIDYQIASSLKKVSQTNEADKNSLINNIPTVLRTVASNRLEYLSENVKQAGIVINNEKNKSTVIFTEDNWQEYLRGKGRSRVFAKITKNENVIVDSFVSAHSSYGYNYKGKVLAKTVIDYEKEKVAFLVKDCQTGEFHFAETRKNFNAFKEIEKGDEVAVISQSPVAQTKTGKRFQPTISVSKITLIPANDQKIETPTQCPSITPEQEEKQDTKIDTKVKI